MPLKITAELSLPINKESLKRGKLVMGEYVYLIERNGKIEIHQNKGKIAEIPNDIADKVRNFKPLWALISGIKSKNQLTISLIN